MKRAALIAVLAVCSATQALACKPGLTLSQVLATAENTFQDNPRTTIHQCFRPYLEAVSEEPSLEVREKFLFFVVTRTASRAFGDPPRPHYEKLIINAGGQYLDLFNDLQPEARQSERCQRVLLAWGKALLISSRKNAFADMLTQYEYFASTFPQHLSGPVVDQWEAALRCKADPDGCRVLREFNCALEGTCGDDETVIARLQSEQGSLKHWQDLNLLLETAIQTKPALKVKKEKIAALLMKVTS